MDIESLKRLIEDFKRLPKIKKEKPTIFELTRYPHYENVISNILSFYFDQHEIHGLSDLLLRSFLDCINPDEDNSYLGEELDVETEVVLASGKRIDLMVAGESFLLVIENKIFHTLENDLDEYSKHAEKSAKDRRVFKAVLSLYPIGKEQLYAGFVNITYQEFFGMVKKNLPSYSQGCDEKYLMYLHDLITTIRNLERGTTMDKKFITFLKDNEQEVVDVLSGIKDFNDELRGKIKTFNESMRERLNTRDSPSDSIKIWMHKEPPRLFDTAVIDVLSDGKKIALDCVLKPDGWSIQLFERGNPTDISDFLASKGIKTDYRKAERFHGDRVVRNVFLKGFIYDGNVETVAETVFKEIIKKLV